MISTRVRAERRILADPASTALLLAGPSALELWPGLRRIAEVGGRVQVELDAAAAGPASAPAGGPAVVAVASVTAQPPRRTPTAFVTRFAWTGPELPGTDGVLTLTYAPGESRPSTRAELVLESTGLRAAVPDAPDPDAPDPDAPDPDAPAVDAPAVDAPAVDAEALARMARAFLDNLGEAAESCRAA